MAQKRSSFRQTYRNSPRDKTLLAGAAIILITFCWPGAVLTGAEGPGIGFKVGAQKFSDPFDPDRATRARFELELSSAMFWDNHADLAFTVGGSSLGTYKSEDIYTVDGIFVEEYYSDSLTLLDLRLAARFYPLGDSAPIRPYVGGGIGYYWLLDSWDADYYDTVEDPFFPGTYITYFSEEEDTDTIADGFFPFIVAGVTVPVGDHLELLFDVQADFEKEDSGFDLSGPIYMFGCRFRF